MDTSKIKKKLKDKSAHTQKSTADDKTSEKHESADIKPDEKKSELVLSGVDTNQKAEAVQIATRAEEKRAVQTIKDKTENKTEDIVEILIFSLLKEEFAFRISQLHEILRHQRITTVPKMPNYVLGITSLRGKVIPVIDLKTKLFLKEKPSDIGIKGKILILKGPLGPIGALVDKVIGVARIAKSEILPPPSHLTETELKFIDGVAVLNKRFISIIHMEEAIQL